MDTKVRQRPSGFPSVDPSPQLRILAGRNYHILDVQRHSWRKASGNRVIHVWCVPPCPFVQSDRELSMCLFMWALRRLYA